MIIATIQLSSANRETGGSQLEFRWRNVPYIALFVALVAAMSGCATVKSIKASNTRGNLEQLEIGMSGADVLRIMGKPWKNEPFASDTGTVQIWYYITHPIPDGATTEDEATPVVIRNNHLEGWGRAALQNALR